MTHSEAGPDVAMTRCASAGCGAAVESPYLWRVDGEPWCQPCFWKLMEDMDKADIRAARSMDHE